MLKADFEKSFFLLKGTVCEVSSSRQFKIYIYATVYVLLCCLLYTSDAADE